MGCLERSANDGWNAIKIAHHVRVVEPDHTKALCSEPRRPSLVVRSVACVRVAVNLHDDAVFASAEAGDVAADNDLAREFGAKELTIAKG